jgi:hypothetical protein
MSLISERVSGLETFILKVFLIRFRWERERERCLPGLTDRCHEFRRLDRSFRGFKEI